MTLTVSDESGFIELAQQGDRAAFGELVRLYQRRAYSVAYGFVGNRDEALDIAQEAFVKAYKAMDRFDTTMPFYPWLHRIVRNTSLNHLKKRKRRGESSLDGMMDKGVDFASKGRGPSGNAKMGELRDRIDAAMQRLSEMHREILTLRHVQELSYAEIADVLDIPNGTVMSRLHAARRALRERLEQLGTTEVQA